MDPFTAWVLMVGAMGITGGLFVLWVVPRIEAREQRKQSTRFPAE